MEKIRIPAHLNRFSTFYSLDDTNIPAQLFEAEASAPDLRNFPYPLPSAKKEYACFCEQNGVMWYGAQTGLTRYDKNADRDSMRVMYFSADRDIPDNNVRKLYADGEKLWVLCDTGAASIEMKMLTAEEKALLMTEETLKYVSRRGMMSHHDLAEKRNLESILPYGECDNDGGFTATYVLGEIFRYAYCKREYGQNDERTKAAYKTAMDGLEVCLLIMNIPGRQDGFIARTYLTTDEPVPDGFFYKKNGDTALCITNEASLRRGIAGKKIDASRPVHPRLAKHYRDYGYSDDDIIYKGDTSSDEVTIHFAMMKAATDHLVGDDAELKEIIRDTTERLMAHIVDNGYQLNECDGKPTTWAKWNEEYFHTEDGWPDAPLNSAELLMYLRTAYYITGNERWIKEYYHLINDCGYADKGLLHFDRFNDYATAVGADPAEQVMYGDNQLCVQSYYGLLALEDDPVLREKYINGLRTWDHSLLREVTPAYFLPLKSVYDGMPVDVEGMTDWFIHFNVSRLASGTSTVGRADVPKRRLTGGYCETGYLLQPDERFISKLDRDPLEYKNQDSGGMYCVECCFPYTYAYWFGKYNNMIEG